MASFNASKSPSNSQLNTYYYVAKGVFSVSDHGPKEVFAKYDMNEAEYNALTADQRRDLDKTVLQETRIWANSTIDPSQSIASRPPKFNWTLYHIRLTTPLDLKNPTPRDILTGSEELARNYDLKQKGISKEARIVHINYFA
jgi:hypothetical protein